MEMDIMAILMVALGLFAIVLFLLFYVYVRNSRNKKREEIDYEEDLSNEEKYKNIDKDSDNLVDEDIEKEDIHELELQTNNVEDYKEDGSLINSGIIVEPVTEVKETEEKNNEEPEMEEFVPKKKHNS